MLAPNAWTPAPEGLLTASNPWSQPAQPTPSAPVAPINPGGGDAAYTLYEQQQAQQPQPQPTNPNAPLGPDQFSGFLPIIAGMVNQGPWSPEMVQTNQDWSNFMQSFGYGLMGDPTLNPMFQSANTYSDITSGKYDFLPNYSGDIRANPTGVATTDYFGGGKNPATMQAAQISPFQSNRQLDSILGGTAYNNPFLDSVSNAAARRMGNQFNEITMSNIGDEAQAAGQRGGSRQGIAEGIAQRGLAESLGDMNAQLANNAYQSGFNAMTTTQNNKMGLDYGKNLNQANLNQGANQFNALGSNGWDQFLTGLNANIAQNNSNAINSMGQFNTTTDLTTQNLNNTNFDDWQNSYGNWLQNNMGNQVNAPTALAPGLTTGQGIYSNIMDSYGQPQDALWNQILTGIQAMQGSGAPGYSTTTVTRPDDFWSNLLGAGITAWGMRG